MNRPGQLALAAAMSRLEALAAELSTLGWDAKVGYRTDGMPNVYARNPEPGAAALSEHIYTLKHSNGTWMYWWPWAEPIEETPAAAAAVIVRVLRSAGTP
jgi:hypothetical protein